MNGGLLVQFLDYQVAGLLLSCAAALGWMIFFLSLDMMQRYRASTRPTSPDVTLADKTHVINDLAQVARQRRAADC